jgi:hypothetical protein
MTASVPEASEKLRLSDLDWICELGAGGIASVCKAHHCRTSAVFAIKISFDQDPLVVEKEAEVLKIAAGATHVIDLYGLLPCSASPAARPRSCSSTWTVYLSAFPCAGAGAGGYESRRQPSPRWPSSASGAYSSSTTTAWRTWT